MMSAILQLATVVCIISIVSSEGCPNSCRGSSITDGTGGEYGVDVSSAVNDKQFQCLKRCGYQFVIIYAYDRGVVDKNVVSNLANAKDVDFSNVDIYMYPSPMLKSAAEHVSDIVTALEGSRYDTVWIGVEIGNWYDDLTLNQEFFLELVEGFEMHNKSTGVYSSGGFDWNNYIMGRNFTGGSHLPLWYENDDGVPSFDGFSPFGGWSDPYAKQINLEFKTCATPINENWRMV